MRKMIAVCFVAIALVWWGCVRFAQAQEQTEPGDQEQTEAKSAKPTVQENKPTVKQLERPARPYRLDFSLNELENGKKVNTRHYSMNLTDGSAHEVKIGTRVPVASRSASPSGRLLSDTQFQYLDVGTNIWAALNDRDNELVLDVRSEISNIDVAPAGHSAVSPPVVRLIKIDGSTVVIPGKPTILGSVDDSNSNREFQLEVTVTKVK